MRQLVPSSPAPDQVDLARLYAYPAASRWLRANMVTSADGAASLDGVSEGLSSQTDRDVFMLLRALTDVIMVGAGTARAEGYRPARVRDAWRGLRDGRPSTPPIAVISASLNVDPASPLIAGAPPHARTIVITAAKAPPDRRAELARHADVVVAGEETVDLTAATATLAARGHRRMLAEGGPHLLAQLLEAGLLDELCLTVAPLMAGPGAQRIVAGALAAPCPLPLSLAHVLEDNGFLLTRYTRKDQDHLFRTDGGSRGRQLTAFQGASEPARIIRCGGFRRRRRSRDCLAFSRPALRGVGPGVPGAAVLGDRDRPGSLAHAAGVEESVEVVDLMSHQPGHSVVEDDDVLPAVRPGAGDLDVQRAGDEAADVEEGQAALVLLVSLGGLADDDGVEHDDGLSAEVGRDDDRGGAGDADLRGSDAHALAEDVLLAGPLQRAEQLSDHRFRFSGLFGEPERGGLLVQDRITVPDDTCRLHAVCRGAQLWVLLAVIGPGAEAPFEPVSGADWRVAG
jgi:riboflavin biosynthesis pyrimidine reductase